MKKKIGFRKKIKNFIRPTLLSFLVIIAFPIAAYVLQQKWFMYVGTVVMLLFIWLMEIVQFETPLDDKAYEEAISMLGRKKQVHPVENNVVPGTRDIPLATPKPPMEMVAETVSNNNGALTKLKNLKNESMLIDSKIAEVEKEKQDLIEEYNDQMNSLQLKISGLEETKKELKEKMLELI